MLFKLQHSKSNIAYYINLLAFSYKEGYFYLLIYLLICLGYRCDDSCPAQEIIASYYITHVIPDFATEHPFTLF